MKELSIEEKAKAYDEAIERAKKAQQYDDCNVVPYIFPKLKEESEDERIREALLEMVHDTTGDELWVDYNVHKEEAIAWLEKQGETYPIISNSSNIGKNGKKPADKIEPKFHEGDWISGYYTNYKVLSVNNEGYVVEDADGNKINILFENEKFHHLWTIQDAKDGDVLFTSSTASHETFIFKSIDEKGNAKCYFAYDSEDGFREGKYHFIGSAINCKPATKEQRDTLIKATTDAGYTFDFKKKKLKKIEQKYAEWNKEDKNTLDFLVDYLSDTVKKMPAEEYAGGLGKAVVLLKAIKDKVQPKQEWSEEDESMRTRCIGILGKCYMGELPTKVEEELNWLKSLRPQNTWKPSDEQMNALNTINITGCITDIGQGPLLVELYQDLKKLKG